MHVAGLFLVFYYPSAILHDYIHVFTVSSIELIQLNVKVQIGQCPWAMREV